MDPLSKTVEFGNKQIFQKDSDEEIPKKESQKDKNFLKLDSKQNFH